MNDYLQLVLNEFPELDRCRLPRIDVDHAFCVSEDILGRYKDGTIRVVQDCDPLTLLHEIGHWVYEELFKREKERHGKGMWSGESIQEFQWRELRDNGSKTASELLDLFDKAKQTPAYQAVATAMPTDFSEQFPLLVLLSLSETWANAFAQALAVRYKAKMPQLSDELSHQLGEDPQASLSETSGYWPIAQFNGAGLDHSVFMCIRS